MSLGSNQAKIATKVNDTLKFLKNIDTENWTYDLCAESGAEKLTAQQAIVAQHRLSEAEPDKSFFIYA